MSERELVRFETVDGIGVITVDNPPVNALSPGVPDGISFTTKPYIALGQIRCACAAGIPRGVVLMDSAYGSNTDLRTSVSALALSYVAGVDPQTSVWAPGTEPLPPKHAFWSHPKITVLPHAAAGCSRNCAPHGRRCAAPAPPVRRWPAHPHRRCGRCRTPSP